MSEIMSNYSPKWMAAAGIIVSFINSFAFPLYGMIYAKILFVMMIGPRSPDFGKDRDFWCGMFLIEVFCIGVFSFLQKYLFQYVGENLTYDIRKKLFEGIIYKNIGWFDNKNRAPGILTNVLSEDIGALNGMTTEHFAILMEAFLGLIVGVIIGMLYTWKMGLVTLGTVPFVSLGGVMMSRIQWKTKPNSSSASTEVEDPYKKSNALLSDIIMNYRTVIGFGEKNCDYLLGKFDELLHVPNQAGIKTAHWTGFFFGYSQCIRFV